MNGASPALLLGIDAGGTSVDAVTAEPDGTVTGTGHAAAGNPVAVALETVTGHVAEAVKNALGDADPARVASAVLAVAGLARFTSPDGERALRRVWRQAGLRCGVRVVADPVAAFAAGTAAERGAVLVSGTGAVAAIIDGAEVTSRVDGHGWLAGDDGSGFWLGRQAVRAVLAELDGRGEPTALRSPVLTAMTGRDELPPDAGRLIGLLCDAVYQGPPTGLARLAPLVAAAADRGDRVAGRIVDRAVVLLMGTVQALLEGQPPGSGGQGARGAAGGSAGRAAGRAAGGSAGRAAGRAADGGDVRWAAGWPGPLVLAGSVLTSPGPVQRELRRRIWERYGSGPLIAGSGAGGAAWLAARAMPGPDPREDVHARLTARA